MRTHYHTRSTAHGLDHDRAADWRDRAACRDVDPETMYPHERSEDGIAAAKAVCVRCPVEQWCLDYALQVGEDYGIWGGLTPMERRRVKAGKPPVRAGVIREVGVTGG